MLLRASQKTSRKGPSFPIAFSSFFCLGPLEPKNDPAQTGLPSPTLGTDSSDSTRWAVEGNPCPGAQGKEVCRTPAPPPSPHPPLPPRLPDGRGWLCGFFLRLPVLHRLILTELLSFCSLSRSSHSFCPCQPLPGEPAPAAHLEPAAGQSCSWDWHVLWTWPRRGALGCDFHSLTSSSWGQCFLPDNEHGGQCGHPPSGNSGHWHHHQPFPPLVPGPGTCSQQMSEWLCPQMDAEQESCGMEPSGWVGGWDWASWSGSWSQGHLQSPNPQTWWRCMCGGR